MFMCTNIYMGINVAIGHETRKQIRRGGKEVLRKKWGDRTHVWEQQIKGTWG